MWPVNPQSNVQGIQSVGLYKRYLSNKIRSTRSWIISATQNVTAWILLLNLFFFSPPPVLWSLFYNAKTSSLSHLPSIPLSLPSFLPRLIITLKHSEHSCRLPHWLLEFTFYFTGQTCSTLPNVFNTSTFIKHQPTNRKNIYIYIFTFLTCSMHKKGLGNIIHIKKGSCWCTQNCRK